MKRKITIQLKAAFLLLVFGLNTIGGFACAVGLDMSFNTTHHDDEVTAPAIHIHTDGKKHVHNKAIDKPSVQVHAGGKKHDHNSELVKQHHEEKETPQKDKDDCCNDNVLKFQNLDKNLSPDAKTVINIPAFAAILSPIFDINVLKAVKVATQKYLVRNFHPPPPDIRIAIRSFQI